MKSDLSRDTFDRARHYSAVRLQQGRVVTDADWNEQADLTRYRAERAARDTIGACGAPVDAAGYGLVAETYALAVHALNSNVVWIAAEDGGLLRTTNGGADWTPVDLHTTANVRSLAHVGGTGWAVGDGGVIRKTTNQGASWIAQNAGTLRALRGVAVFDADHAWAVGDGGVVVATSDGGATWSLAQTSAARLYAVHFIDELAGLAVGQGGAILSTSDGGQTWSSATSGTTAHLRAIAVFGTTLSWAAGQRGTILRSQDGGTTWTACNTPSTGPLYTIGFRDQNEGWAAGAGGVVLRTTDGGANWTLEDVGTEADLRAISFFSTDPGWLVGDGSTALLIGGGSPDVAPIALPAINLSILPGRCYVNGMLCELEARASYGNQSDGGTLERLAPGGYLIYLDAWQRHLSALEAPLIREVALDGPDTATRARTLGQVRALALPPSSPFDWNCSSSIDAWDALVQTRKPVLAARAEPQLAATGLCEIAATAGYRRLENQLYRVEVHEGGLNPTFKWSRENGSVAYAVESISVDEMQRQTTVRLAARGRDTNLDLAVHDRVELVDDDAEAIHRAGVLLEYLNDGNDELELVLAGVPGGSLGQDPSRHPILRRWDHQPTIAGTNLLPIVEGAWMELEEGVQVRFGPGGSYRPGDYWQIPARTITADVEWPRDDDGDPIARPPVGIADGYCRLGIVEVAADGSVTVSSDCRNLFPTLGATETLLYVSGDGQEAAPDALVPHPLAVRVGRGDSPVAGRTIRFAIESGGGNVGAGGTTIELTTDADGQAWCDWQLGPAATAPASHQRVRASLLDLDGQPLPGQFVVFCATATLALRYVSGDGQSAAAGTALPFPLEVQAVSGADGVAGALLRATVEQGSGVIVGAATRTADAQGQASFGWQLGGAGPQRVRVELIDGTGQVVQRLAFDASLSNLGTSKATLGCEVTIGEDGDFETLTADNLREVLERGRGSACVCFRPGTHKVPGIDIGGQGAFRLSIHGCGHTSLLNLDGPLTFNAFAAIEVRDLAMQGGSESSLSFQKNDEVRLANVRFDREGDAGDGAVVRLLGARSVSVTGCEILSRMPATAAMFQEIEGVCRVVGNRFVGIVSFYGETAGAPPPALLRKLAARTELRLTPGGAQLSFCQNELSLLSVATAMAKRLSADGGTAAGVFASAIVHGNTFMEQNSVFVAGLLGFSSNAFVAPPAADSRYGVMLALRATAEGNLALVLGDQAPLSFVVPDAVSFAKAANQVFVQP